MPRIDAFRPQIEQHASAALGVPVRIGGIEVRSSGWVPALTLRDVVLQDPQGREALRLPSLAAAVSARSLLAFDLRFEQLLIEGADLEVRRDAQGRFFIAGIELAQRGGPSDGGIADWVFRQREFVIRGSRLRWIDERQARPVAFDDVVLVLRNRLRSHDLRFDATPPDDWGARFSLRAKMAQPLFAPAGQWRRWSGTLYAELPDTDLGAVARDFALDASRLPRGSGQLRAWLDVAAGAVRGGTVDVAVHDLVLDAADDAPALRLARFGARLQAQQDGRQIVLSARRLSFSTPEGQQWPEGGIALTWRRDGTKAPAPIDLAEIGQHLGVGGELDADRLDLALLTHVGERLPLPPALRRTLRETMPEGVATGVHAQWDGAWDAPERYRVQARLDGLGIAARPAPGEGLGRPGLRNAAVAFDADEKGGSASVTIDQGELVFPGVFEEPQVPVSAAAAQLRWRIAAAESGPPAVELRVSGAKLANADLETEFEGAWRNGTVSPGGRGGRSPGHLQLTGRLASGAAERTARYLPLSLGPHARDYVRQAVRSGRIRQATFQVRGDLREFPFDRGRDGEFRIEAAIDGTDFDYAPAPIVGAAWPPFSNLAGELVIDRASLAIRGARADLYGVELSGVDGGIADLAHHGPALEITGTARGPLADLLRFVRTTPVAGWTDHALDGATGAGAAELKLELHLPIAGEEAARVRGSVLLAGNDLAPTDQLPMLAGARGRIDFTQQGFTLSGFKARFLGGEVAVEGGSQGGALRLAASGTATADGLRAAREFGGLPVLAGRLQGQAAYTANIGHGSAGTELTITSGLQGLAVDLPDPLRKPAEAAWPLRLQRTMEPAPAGAPARDRVAVELGNDLRAAFVRELAAGGTRVLRGGIGIGDAPPDPPQGVAAAVRFDRLDVDAWRTALRTSGIAPGGAEGAGASGYLPATVALQAREMRAGARRLANVQSTITHRAAGGEDIWHAAVQADQLQGDVEFHGGATNRVVARLRRLSLPPSDADSAGALVEETDASLPSLDVAVDDLELRGRKFGRVEVEAIGRPREWALTRLSVAVPEAQLNATGRWAAASARAPKRMQMDFKLDLADSGALLERLGMGRVLRGGKGTMQGEVSWAGSPFGFDVPSLDGQVRLALASGQFLTADPGASRLLGVLSLQALPRRLALDFRDVFGQGFAFDEVNGDARIDDGVATTNNLRMRGASAAVLMEGSADMQRETQSLHVIVVPEIDAGTATLAYAVINPAIGLGSFLAQWFLKRPLMQASTREFRVSGPWSDPKVEKIERALNAPLPDFAAPPAAAASPAARTP